MLAQKNEYLQEAVSGVRQLTAEEQIRQQCQAREDYLYWERIRTADAKRTQQQLADAQAIIIQKDAYIAELEAQLKQYK